MPYDSEYARVHEMVSAAPRWARFPCSPLPEWHLCSARSGRRDQRLGKRRVLTTLLNGCPPLGNRHLRIPVASSQPPSLRGSSLHRADGEAFVASRSLTVH